MLNLEQNKWWISCLLTLLLLSSQVYGKKRAGEPVLDFEVVKVLDVGEAPTYLAINDLDGDGTLDMIVANARSRNLSIFTQNQSGIMYLRRTIEGTFGELLTGDFNRDGRPDLLVVDNAGKGFQVFINEGGLQLNPKATLLFDGSLSSSIGRTCALGDFNRDNLIDVAAALITPKGEWKLLLAYGMGDGRLSNELLVPLTHKPISIAALDVNKDGFTDIATADSRGVTLLFGNHPLGDIGEHLELEESEEIRGNLITSADFNSDGQSDIAVANNDGMFWILSGNGQGRFTVTQRGRERGSLSTAVADDFNGDGRPDLALIRNIGDVAILFSKPGGALMPAAYFTLSGGNTLGAMTADLNADGFADLIAANSGSNSVSFLYGRRDGFITPRHYLVDAQIAQSIRVDFNGDGLQDLAITEQNANGRIRLLRGNGKGAFTAAGSIKALPNPGGIASADLDRDGRPDFVCSGGSTDQIGILLSSRGLAEMLTFEVGSQYGGPGAIAIGDFDADSLLDIALANFNITIFFGFQNNNFKRIEHIDTGAVPSELLAGDFNGDGITDLATETCCQRGALFVLLGVRNSTPLLQKISVPESSFSGLAAADFNHDNISDIAFTDPINRHVVILTLGKDGQPINVERITTRSPFLLQTGDINNDSEIDLIALNEGYAAIILGFGNGKFQLGPSIRTSTLLQPVLGDFNRDQKNDLIFAGRDYIEPIISRKKER
jgi:hypothetical protein